MFINYVQFKTDVLIGDEYRNNVSADNVDFILDTDRGVDVESDGMGTLVPWCNVKFATYRKTPK
jgi:hypothetical protein